MSDRCTIPPPGWYCSRPGPHPHEGPCAARPLCKGHEDIFQPPPAVRCQCTTVDDKQCTGTLMTSGRNRRNDLTFLECDACGCCYAASDYKKETSP